jgi:hypothetical protein
MQIETFSLDICKDLDKIFLPLVNTWRTKRTAQSYVVDHNHTLVLALFFRLLQNFYLKSQSVSYFCILTVCIHGIRLSDTVILCISTIVYRLVEPGGRKTPNRFGWSENDIKYSVNNLQATARPTSLLCSRMFNSGPAAVCSKIGRASVSYHVFYFVF